MPQQGVVYIATGQKFITEALQAVASLKRHMPDSHVTLFSDQQPQSDLFDAVTIIEQPQYSFMDKIQQLKHSPYEHTLFLDTDTLVCGPLDELFTLLAAYDIAAAYDNIGRSVPVPAVPSPLPEFNTGVMVFRQSDKWQAFCDAWRDRYQYYIDGGLKNFGDMPVNDQTPFLECIHSGDLRMAVLPGEYNCPMHFSGFLNGPMKVLHGRHPFAAAMADKLNQWTGMRVHYMRYYEKQVKRYETADVRKSPYYSLRKRINLRLRRMGLR